MIANTIDVLNMEKCKSMISKESLKSSSDSEDEVLYTFRKKKLQILNDGGDDEDSEEIQDLHVEISEYQAGAISETAFVKNCPTETTRVIQDVEIQPASTTATQVDPVTGLSTEIIPSANPVIITDVAESEIIFNNDIYDPENSNESIPEDIQQIETNEGDKYLNNIGNDVAEEEEESSNSNQLKEKKQDHKLFENRRTKKERDKELIDIYGESQRLLRETNVTIPYHRPPKRSLKEFLRDRRKSSSLHMQLGLKRVDSLSYLKDKKQSNTGPKNFETKNLPYEKILSESFDKHTVLNPSNVCGTVHKKQCEIIDIDAELKGKTNIQLCNIYSERNNITSSGPLFLDHTSENLEEKISETLEISIFDNDSRKASLQLLDKTCTMVKNMSEIHQKTPAMNPDGESMIKDMCSSKPLITSIPNKVILDNFEINGLSGTNNSNDIEHISDGKAKNLTENIVEMPCTSSQDKNLSVKQAKISDVAMSLKPRLSGAPNEVIELEGSSYSPSVPKRGLDLFIEKFMHHTKQVSKKMDHQEVNLSIVSKDEKQQGKLNCSKISVNVHSLNNADKTLTTPGSKLFKLKEKLLCEITKKREVAVERHKQMCQLDDEELGFEEEEAELTDESDTEKNEDEHEKESIVSESENEGGSDEEEEEKESDEINDYESHKKKKNCFIDDEASESDNDELPCHSFLSMRLNKSGGQLANCTGNTPRKSFISNSVENFANKPTSGSGLKKDTGTECLKKHIGLESLKEDARKESLKEDTYIEENRHQDSELRLFLESDSEDACIPDNTSSQMNDSLVSTGSTITTYQPGGGFTHLKENALTQDGHDSEELSENDKESQIDGSQQLWPSQESSCVSQESNLCSSNEKGQLIKSTPDLSGLIHEESSQDNNEGILALCSGKFTDSQTLTNFFGSTSHSPNSISLPFNIERNSQKDKKSPFCTPKKHFLSVESFQSANTFPEHSWNYTGEKDLIKGDLSFVSHSASQPKINELLGLCSGKFTDSSFIGDKSSPDFKEENDDLDDDDAKSIISFIGTSKNKSKVRTLSDSEDEDAIISDAQSNYEAESDPEVDDLITIKENTETVESDRAKAVREFLEDEAELSGSDVGSDEEEDGGDDNYEEDMIETEELPSDDELRDQIGKVHFKKIMDDDKRELRLYQELYLEDGDLHSDGPGRQRKFTWRNVDGSVLCNGNEQNSESENEEVQEEEKWRIERHEREKWLQEQEEKGIEIEKSPVSMMRRRSSLKIEIVNRVKEKAMLLGDEASESENKTPNLKNRRGSLLARGQDYLVGLAKKFKKADDDTMGSRTTKHFVFRAVSPRKKNTPNINNPDRLNRPSTSGYKRNSSQVVTVPTKRRKSVFDYFEQH